MKDKNPFDWELLFREEGGHKVFRDNNTQKLAIADCSGYFPEQTVDGVLWLDPTTTIRYRDGTWFMPVTSRIRQEFLQAPTSGRMVMLLNKHFGMKVEIDGVVFTSCLLPDQKAATTATDSSSVRATS